MISKRNIKIIYILTVLKYSWFWLGIWVLYYSSFIGYVGLGMAETVRAVTQIVAEIPSGAIGDLLGKKRTLALAMFLNAVGNIWMAFAPSLGHLLGSIFVMNVGGAFWSGSFEAMIYDTLKQDGAEKTYNKVLSNISTISLITLTVVGTIGGFMYKVNPGLPFLITGIMKIGGSILALALIEPKIDTEQFSLMTFFKQNLKGFNLIFKNRKVTRITLALLSISGITMILYEGFNDILAVEIGFTPIQLGILASVFSLAGAISAQLGRRITDRFGDRITLIVSSFFYGGTLLLSFMMNKFLGAFLILTRFILDPVINNEVSTILNESLESKSRATGISTFSMIKSIPYAIVIFSSGFLLDKYPARSFAIIFGTLLVTALLISNRVLKEKM